MYNIKLCELVRCSETGGDAVKETLFKFDLSLFEVAEFVKDFDYETASGYLIESIDNSGKIFNSNNLADFLMLNPNY